MSDYELLSIILMVLGIVVSIFGILISILIAYINGHKKK